MAVPLRLFDVFNCKIGATQVKGASGFDVNWGFREQVASGDGQIAEDAHDKGPFYADGTLRCNDVAGFPGIIALFKDNDTQDVLAEGKIHGDPTNAYQSTLKRCKLLSAAMDYRSGDYLHTTYNVANSADNTTPSTSPQDEFILASVVRAITTSGDARLVRFNTGVSFLPNGGSPLAPLGIAGFAFSVAGKSERTAGDEDFGENVDVGGYAVTGQLLFRDLTLAAGAAISHALIAATYGVLTLPYSPEAGAAARTLTLRNLMFTSERVGLVSQRFHGPNALSFRCRLGGSVVSIAANATAANNIISEA